jgi:uncharacterized OB-fold protein
MAAITAIGTYLPCWGNAKARQKGDDEDAVTLAVAAGLGALRGVDPTMVSQVVVVSRDLPLLEGGNSAAVLAGLGLSAHTRVSEVVGGAPAVLDAITAATAGTLVIGADASGAAGASAAFCGPTGPALTAVDRITRSMPVTTRDGEGHRSDYSDPRLLRVRGVGVSMDQIDRSAPIMAVAGLAARDAASIAEGTTPALPTTGASSVIFALAALAEAGRPGRVAAVEQAAVVVAELTAGAVTVVRDERAARPAPKGTLAPGNDLPVSLAAYDRAFDAKLRLEAAKCTSCGTLSYPHRYRCITCGSEAAAETVALPRDAEIYTLSTIHVPVPGLISPYSITLVELGDTGVRVLVRLTGAPPGSVQIGDRGRLVFRLVAVRSGVPDYGYGFLPEEASAAGAETKESAA